MLRLAGMISSTDRATRSRRRSSSGTRVHVPTPSSRQPRLKTRLCAMLVRFYEFRCLFPLWLWPQFPPRLAQVQVPCLEIVRLSDRRLCTCICVCVCVQARVFQRASTRSTRSFGRPTRRYGRDLPGTCDCLHMSGQVLILVAWRRVRTIRVHGGQCAFLPSAFSTELISPMHSSHSSSRTRTLPMRAAREGQGNRAQA